MGILDRIRSFLELGRARYAEARGDLASARDTYRDALGRCEDSDKAAILNKLGMLSDALGDKAAARSWFEQATAADPDAWAPYMNLGNVLDTLGERAAARAAYAQALARTRRPDLLYNYAVLLAKEDPRAAVALLRECLDSGPALDEVELPAELPLQNLVRLGERDELFEEVSRHLQELESQPIGLEPWSVSNQRAILMSRAGRHDEALASFARIFETWPNSSDDVRFNLGMALIRLGRWEDARTEFEQVDFPVAHYGLALTYEKTGRVQDAVREHRTFVEQMAELPHDPWLVRVPDLLPNWLEESKAFIAAHSQPTDPSA